MQVDRDVVVVDRRRRVRMHREVTMQYRMTIDCLLAIDDALHILFRNGNEAIEFARRNMTFRSQHEITVESGIY